MLAQLPPTNVNLMHRQGYKQFRDVQTRAFNPLSEGKNAVIIAPTAGGKTEAVLWPTLSRLHMSAPRTEGVRLLVIAPLKALLNNLEPRVEYWAKALGLRCFKWHGDVQAAKKLREQQRPSEILLTTPESLEVLLTLKEEAEGMLGALETAIVDEAHHFAAMSRGAQLVALLERVSSRKDVQRVGLSATVGNPQIILDWISGSSQRPGEVRDVPGRW